MLSASRLRALVSLSAALLVLATVPAAAEPISAPRWNERRKTLQEGVMYYRMGGGQQRLVAPGSSTEIVTNIPIATHMITVSRMSRRYELRVLADQVDPRKCDPTLQLPYRTHSVAQFATASRPRALAAVNGAVWGPASSNSDGRAEGQIVFPLSTLVTNFDIRHMRQYTLVGENYLNGEAMIGFARAGSMDKVGAMRIGRADFFDIGYHNYRYYAIGSATSVMKDGACAYQNQPLPDGKGAYSLVGYGPSSIFLMATDQTLVGGYKTFTQLCEVIKGFGGTDAVLLDGGQSTQMYVSGEENGGLVNPLLWNPLSPFKTQRYVANAIGVIDTDDFAATPTPLYESDCNNGIDENRNGAIDCADPDCLINPLCASCADASCSEDVSGTELRRECLGVCSSLCNVGAADEIAKTVGALPPSARGTPCDIWESSIEEKWTTFSRGHGIYDFGGTDTQTFCRDNACMSPGNITGYWAVMSNACRTEAFVVENGAFRTYRCIQDSSGRLLGPDLLGPPTNRLQRDPGGPLAPVRWKQNFLRGSIWFGYDDILRIETLHVHYGPDAADNSSIRKVLEQINQTRTDDCVGQHVQMNPPGPSECFDECSPGSASILCISNNSYIYCGSGFDDDPCSEYGPVDSPMKCTGDLTFCRDGVGCSSCGRMAGDDCCPDTVMCSGSLICSAGTCQPSGTSNVAGVCPLRCGAPTHSSGERCDGNENTNCCCTDDRCGVLSQQHCDATTHRWGACVPDDYEGECNDGKDNDCNGLVDCADPDCVGRPECPATAGTGGMTGSSAAAGGTSSAGGAATSAGGTTSVPSSCTPGTYLACTTTYEGLVQEGARVCMSTGTYDNMCLAKGVVFASDGASSGNANCQFDTYRCATATEYQQCVAEVNTHATNWLPFTCPPGKACRASTGRCDDVAANSNGGASSVTVSSGGALATGGAPSTGGASAAGGYVGSGGTLSSGGMASGGFAGGGTSACLSSPETCANVGVDSDCDGDRSELVNAVHEGDACVTDKPGICSAGSRACDGSTLGCIPNLDPVTEVCGNRIDEDCDGFFDNGCPTSCLSQVRASIYKVCLDSNGDIYYRTSAMSVLDTELTAGLWHLFIHFEYGPPAGYSDWAYQVELSLVEPGIARGFIPNDLPFGLCPQVSDTHRHPFRISEPHKGTGQNDPVGVWAPVGSELSDKQPGLLDVLPDQDLKMSYSVAAYRDVKGDWLPAATLAHDDMLAQQILCAP